MASLIYQSLDALESAKKIIAEAAAGLGDKMRTINTSSIPNELGATVGITAGVGIGVGMVSAAGVSGLSAVGISSGLAALGSVIGGGMLAGVFVAAAPMALLGIAGYGVLAWQKQQQLIEAKEALFQDALLKRLAVLSELQNTVGKADERVAYLEALNIKLREVIENLAKDLGKDVPAPDDVPPPSSPDDPPPASPPDPPRPPAEGAAAVEPQEQLPESGAPPQCLPLAIGT